MSRGALAVAGGGAVLLVVAVLMLRALGDDPAEATATPHAKSETAAPTAAPAPEPSPNRDGKIVLPPLAAAKADPWSQPAQPPGPSSGESEPALEVSYWKREPLANKTTLRQQTAAVEPMLVDCINQHGRGVTGKTVLTFIVVPVKDKAVLDTTGWEPDNTTIENEKLLDCMKDTAKSMSFVPQKDSVSIYVTRQIEIENGKLVTNRFIDFHRVR